MHERVELSQRMHFLYWSFYVNMKNQHFFSPDLAVTWGFCPDDFSLCPSECMLYECVTMNSLCIFTWRKKNKQKNCPMISKPKRRPSPTESVGNQFDMALTSMYTKVLTEWDDRRRSTKCWQRNLSQYSLLPVIIIIMSFVITYHAVEAFLSVLVCRRRLLCARWDFAWMGSIVSM